MKLTNPLKNSILKKYPDGDVRQWYGENIDLYMQAIGSKGHTGVDIATFEGDEVLAAHDGVIIERYNASAGYGYHVRVVSDKQPDGTYIETIYGHLREDIPINVNDRVKAGQVIGFQSNTGFVISGGTAYWSTAPAGKGVHLHWGLRILEDVQPNTQQISFSSGHSFTIKNYKNGLFGYIDPMLFLETMKLDLYREVSREAIYAKINDKYYWISAKAMDDLVKQGLARWEDVKEISEKIIQEGVIS